MEIEGIQLRHKYYFIDESGDPNFYGFRQKNLMGTDGFQPYLLVGMVETENRKALRDAIITFRDEMYRDVLYNSIPSIAKNKDWYLHARNDHPEVRIQFFEMLRRLDGFKAHVVVARKDEKIFEHTYNNNPIAFYFDVLRELLGGRLLPDFQHQIYLSERKESTFPRFEKAVSASFGDESGCQYNLEMVPGSLMPELSVIDYLMWALQRKLIKGESRFFDALKDKFGDVVTMFGT